MTDTVVHHLSRAKIQRLLTAVGSVATPATDQPELPLYDWRDPHYFDEDQRNRLAAVMSQVAALLSEKFVHFYGAESNVAPTSITEHFGGDLPRLIELDRSFCLTFGPDAKHACGFLTVDATTALSWVTLLLGDSETESDPDRVLSPLEQSLLSDVIVAITDAFLGALRPHVDFIHDADMTRGQSLVSYESTAEICVITFAVRRADANEASEMRFVLPCCTLAPLVGKSLQPAATPPQDQLQCIMMEHLQQMPVTVTVKLTPTRLSFEEVLDLGPGDIVLLDQRVDRPVDLVLDNQTIFRGRPVRSEGRYAALITECTAQSAPATGTPPTTR